MLKLTIQQIYYFLDLCDTLKFTETARRNYLSQPALSRQISLLEEKAGTQLFIRNHRNVTLTPEGELVKKEFLTFMEQCNHMMDSISQIANHKKGTLRLGFSEFIELSPICKKLGLSPKNLIYSPTMASLFASLTCGVGYTVSEVHIISSAPEILKAFCTDILYPEPICAMWDKDNPNFALKDFHKMFAMESDMSM